MADPADDLLPLIGVNLGQDDNQEPSGSGSSDESSMDGSGESSFSDNEMEFDEYDEDNEELQDQNRHVLDGGDNQHQPQQNIRHEMNKRKKPSKKRIRGNMDGHYDDDIVHPNPNPTIRFNFDRALPIAHQYLGNDLEEIRGRTIFEEGSVVTMSLMVLPAVVLVPGQVLPLHLFRESMVSMMRRVADGDNTFGVVNISRMENVPDNLARNVSKIGCTAEIYCLKDELDRLSGLSTVTVKARGRQRFKVLSMNSGISGQCLARVKILPETSLSHALNAAWVPSMRRLMAQPQDDGEDMVKTAVDRQGRVLASVDLRRKNPVTRLTAGHFTWWPPWVYKMYDIDWLAEQIRDELQGWCSTALPSDPVDLSFWVAHNLPVADMLRLRLLSFDSVVQRLRFGLDIIRKSGKLLTCEECTTEIASKQDVFSMSCEGPLGAYVNPHGHVHEMFTVTTANNLNHVGSAYTEHSWFPGYAWTIVQCKRCHSHMGWKFTATKKELSPRKFWGLCRSSVRAEFGILDEKKAAFTM